MENVFSSKHFAQCIILEYNLKHIRGKCDLYFKLRYSNAYQNKIGMIKGVMKGLLAVA